MGAEQAETGHHVPGGADGAGESDVQRGQPMWKRKGEAVGALGGGDARGQGAGTPALHGGCAMEQRRLATIEWRVRMVDV